MSMVVYTLVNKLRFYPDSKIVFEWQAFSCGSILHSCWPSLTYPNRQHTVLHPAPWQYRRRLIAKLSLPHLIRMAGIILTEPRPWQNTSICYSAIWLFQCIKKLPFVVSSSEIHGILNMQCSWFHCLVCQSYSFCLRFHMRIDWKCKCKTAAVECPLLQCWSAACICLMVPLHYTHLFVHEWKVSLYTLTLSSPVVSNGYTTKCSKPYWSNPPFLFFWHSGTLALRTVKKIKMVG